MTQALAPLHLLAASHWVGAASAANALAHLELHDAHDIPDAGPDALTGDAAALGPSCAAVGARTGGACTLDAVREDLPFVRSGGAARAAVHLADVAGRSAVDMAVPTGPPNV